MLKDDDDPCAEPNADWAEEWHRNCTKAHKKERDPHQIAAHRPPINQPSSALVGTGHYRLVATVLYSVECTE